MNPLSALRAVLALTLFPGAAYAGAVAVAAAWAGRVPAGRAPARLEELAGATGVMTAAGLLALPGSPLEGLPTGVSLAGLLTALTAGLAWGTSARWPWPRLAAAAAALFPLLAVAIAARTLDLRTMAVAPVEAARVWAAAAALLALPALIRPFDAGPSRSSRACLLATSALLALSLAVGSPLSAQPAAAVAVVCGAGSVLYAGALGVLRRPLAAAAGGLGVLALLPAAVAVALSLGLRIAPG
jgi:hypothetical protein